MEQHGATELMARPGAIILPGVIRGHSGGWTQDGSTNKHIFKEKRKKTGHLVKFGGPCTSAPTWSFKRYDGQVVAGAVGEASNEQRENNESGACRQ